MPQRIILSLGIIFASFIVASNYAYAQNALKPRKSPLVIKTVKYENTYVKVNYGAPHMRSRKVFGDLVPYGKVWRTGANEATEITFTKDVKIHNKVVKAGTYTLFTIPGEESWQIILNTKLGQWGAFEYDDSKNYLVFDVSSEENNKTYEPFTIEFKSNENVAYCRLMWEKTLVQFPIEFL